MSTKDVLTPLQSGSCCSTTADGNSVCHVAQEGQASTCGCRPYEAESTVSIPVAHVGGAGPESAWHKTRAGIMVAVACLTSPCCTPLYVPLILTLFAGTPLALWISQHVGWVYGGLTFISLMTIVGVLAPMVRRWLATRKPLPSTTTSTVFPAKGASSHATESTPRR